MAFALRCPDCRKAFRWEPTKEFPESCPLCGAQMADDKSENDNVIVMPAFLSAKTRQNDQVQRQAVDASEQRVYKAAEMAGCDASDMAALKVTDLRPTRHEGDVAHVPVQNAVSQQMDYLQQRGAPVGFGAGANGSEFASGIATGAVTVNGQVFTGIEPRAGARAAERTQKILHGMR